jgi:hypothetical protein
MLLVPHGTIEIEKRQVQSSRHRGATKKEIMDTLEARRDLRDVARSAIAVVERAEVGREPNPEDREALRKAAARARELLRDAGYPGEATWRGLSRASIGVDTLDGPLDHTFWHDVAEELRSGLETLDNLVTSDRMRESDVHLIE